MPINQFFYSKPYKITFRTTFTICLCLSRPHLITFITDATRQRWRYRIDRIDSVHTQSKPTIYNKKQTNISRAISIAKLSITKQYTMQYALNSIFLHQNMLFGIFQNNNMFFIISLQTDTVTASHKHNCKQKFTTYRDTQRSMFRANRTHL